MAATVGARVGVGIFAFGASVIAARVLGLHGRGQLAVLVAVPGVISTVGLLGLDTANLRFAGLSHSAFRQAVRRAVHFSLGPGTAMAAGWLIAGLLWPPVRLGLDPFLALLAAALCPVSVLLSLLGPAEVGRGRTALYNLVMATLMALYFAAVVVLQQTGQLTVVTCFGAYGLSQVAGVIVLLMLSAKRVQADGDSVPLRQYSSYALRAFVPNVISFGMLRMDVPVIQLLAGTTAVALYAVALPFAEILLLLPVAMGLVLFPRVTSGAMDIAAVRRIGVTVLAAMAVIAAGIAVAVPVIVPHLYGLKYQGAVAVIWCMLPGLVIGSAARASQIYLAGTDNLRPVINASVAGLVAGLVALLALTGRFGAVGAGIADSVGYVAFTVAILGGPRLRARAARTRVATAGISIARVTTSGPLRPALPSLLRFRRYAAEKARNAMVHFSNVRSAAFFGTAAVLALGAAVLSTRDARIIMVVLGCLLMVVIIAVPDTGPYLLAVAIPVSQTLFGNRLITNTDLLVLLAACVIGQVGAHRVTLPRARTVVIGVILVCYFTLSLIVVGGGIPSGLGIRGPLLLGAVFLSLPLLARADVVTRRATVAFAFSATFVALLEYSDLACIPG